MIMGINSSVISPFEKTPAETPNEFAIHVYWSIDDRDIYVYGIKTPGLRFFT